MRLSSHDLGIIVTADPLEGGGGYACITTCMQYFHEDANMLNPVIWFFFLGDMVFQRVWAGVPKQP